MLIGEAIIGHLKTIQTTMPYLGFMPATKNVCIGVYQMGRPDVNVISKLYKDDFEIIVRDTDKETCFRRTEEIFEKINLKYNIIVGDVNISCMRAISNIFDISEAGNKYFECQFDIHVDYFLGE